MIKETKDAKDFNRSQDEIDEEDFKDARDTPINDEIAEKKN